MYRLALLSLHGCPFARLGEKDTGGMNVYVLQLARELGRRGHMVDVYTRYHDPRDPQIDELEPGVRVIHIKAGPYHKTKETLYEYIPEFLGNVLSFQRAQGVEYDLIHSHYWLSGRVGEVLSDSWSVPHVVTFHTLAKTKRRARAGEREPELRLSVEQRVMGSADAIVVSTAEEREDLARLYRKSPHNVHVVPAGVDTELFRPQNKIEARRALGLTEKKVILYVGRLEPLKGVDILIDAFSRLADLAEARLLIVGGRLGSDRELKRLRSFAEQLGIADRVTFTGAVKQTELPNYYSAADVFALPSYYESFGLVALEAMACGTPVVVSRVGGLKTFVKHGESGYLIPWRCPEPFAQRLDMLLANPGLRNSLGAAARARALKMSWGVVADEMLGFYSDVTSHAWQFAAGA